MAAIENWTTSYQLHTIKPRLVKMFFKIACFAFSIFMLCGCYDEQKTSGPSDMREFDKHIISAGIGGIRKLPFFDEISKEDKILLENNLQAALNQNDWREWQGDTVRCKIEIGNETSENGLIYREFKQTFFFDSKIYIVNNKACKVFVDQNKKNSFWVLESSAKNYLAR